MLAVVKKFLFILLFSIFSSAIFFHGFFFLDLKARAVSENELTS